MVEEFGQSLDLGAQLNTGKEVIKVSEETAESNEEISKEESPKAEEPKKEEPKKEVKEPKKEVKKTEKKAPAKKKKSVKKPKKEVEEVDDFDDDFEESNLGIYLFWTAAVIVVVLILLWLLTNWKLCIQF